MKEILGNSLFFGVGISIGTYILGTIIKRKVNFFLFNPLLLAITMTIATLLVTGIEYSEYNNGAKYLSYLLTPATVALAIPLYEQESGTGPGTTCPATIHHRQHHHPQRHHQDIERETEYTHRETPPAHLNKESQSHHRAYHADAPEVLKSLMSCQCLHNS